MSSIILIIYTNDLNPFYFIHKLQINWISSIGDTTRTQNSTWNFNKREITQKAKIREIRLLKLTHPLIMTNPHVMFQINWISSIGDTTRTRNSTWNFNKRGITQKVKILGLWLLCMTHPLIMTNHHVKFQINWISSIGETARTQIQHEILIKGE